MNNLALAFDDGVLVNEPAVSRNPAKEKENSIIAKAHEILESRALYGNDREAFTSSGKSRAFFRTRLATAEREVFVVAFLDNRNRLIAAENLFYGTIDGASVHPREVVKRALYHNAAAVMFAHNHPSGVSEPSQADISITRRLEKLLGEIDIRTLDHFIVGDEVYSFAESGLL